MLSRRPVLLWPDEPAVQCHGPAGVPGWPLDVSVC